MKKKITLVVFAVTVMTRSVIASETMKLITLDPGHFHAALIQKKMYPQVSPVVHVYAPEGPDLTNHLNRIEAYNTRMENPTRWEERVFAGPDFLELMSREHAGKVVVISGNNRRKTEYIRQAVSIGLHVLADKPMAITPEDFEQLCKVFKSAQEKKALLYDIMTERYEATSALQRELARMPELFGTLEVGTPENPGVVMESVHHYFKEVSGQPLIRPAWFFDVKQQGEAIPDVGTHLVDLVQWECFPDQVLDWRKDIKVRSARIWPTQLTLTQFKQITGLSKYPEFLQSEVSSNNLLNVRQNGEVNYTIRGIHTKVTARWNYEAPTGAKDSHYSLLRGTRANLIIKQGAEQNYVPTLYIRNVSNTPVAEFERTVHKAFHSLTKIWTGLDVKRIGSAWEVIIPDKYKTGHEAHFAQVTEKYLNYLATGIIPEWETAGMLAKYFTTTEAYRLSH